MWKHSISTAQRLPWASLTFSTVSHKLPELTELLSSSGPREEVPTIAPSTNPPWVSLSFISAPPSRGSKEPERDDDDICMTAFSISFLR